MDNGSSHRGEASVRRLTKTHPRLVPVHGPVHASWLNQIEIYFSIIQRKVLTPNDFPCLGEVAQRLPTSSATSRPSRGRSNGDSPR